MGLFDKIKSGLKKTKDNMVKQVESLIHSFTKIDEEFFEELEETLIMSDVGVTTSVKICDLLREKIKQTGETNPENIKGMIKDIIVDMLKGGENLNL